MILSDKKGFTFVEVIAVIAIVGIAAGIAMPSVVGIMLLRWRDIIKLI
ncbi:prepilin-type N-terminal cleavage/methylation domain-containing protein [Cytobacillus oceanisediminis]|uniref:Prepilin-type N-terminal cleavage/methylation domain-containing protein n=1 Tax=Cytobacillus oceanisediminis TaxID=665099 RepID=A0A2V3A5X8_9BACI|nr:prepilin-type N-terminal cleavage/methylation domain-containing protein [Cytobacillus oceanisediminis]PWW31270.1 prepilin-type N-terminal cleavage/methylation domain-containing protein [Cytobacillus oceanisediminis]